MKRLRQLWERVWKPAPPPEGLSIAVDLGGVTFTASGHQSYVITAYALFLEQLNDAGAADKSEVVAQALPHFRAKPAGTC